MLLQQELLLPNREYLSYDVDSLYIHTNPDEIYVKNKLWKMCSKLIFRALPVFTAIQFQGGENRNIKKGKIGTNANKIRQHISILWKNTLNSRKKPFSNISKLKILQRYSQNYSRKIFGKCQENFHQRLYQTKTKKKQL